MSERRILTIGSQCDALHTKLSFLPSLAQKAYDVMTDSRLGGCVPALRSRAESLLLDPTVEKARTAIENAFRQASDAESTLFILLIGHGEMLGGEFFFLPIDASVPPTGNRALNLVQIIKELHLGGYAGLDGLVVLIDACFAGVAAAEAAQKWIGSLSGTLRFEVLTASGDRPAADGCFTRTLVDVCGSGISSMPWEDVRCEHIRSIAEKKCPKQKPQHDAYNPDPGLFLSKNAATRKTKLSWIGTRASSQVERLTYHFQITPLLELLVNAIQVQRTVLLIGGAGTGKSSLAASLAYPKMTNGIVPDNFIQAIVFISEVTSAFGLANQLSEQLIVSVPGFDEALKDFTAQASKEELALLTAIQRDIVAPLKSLAAQGPICIVLDAVDQLPPDARAAVNSAIQELATDPHLAHMRLLLTSRVEEPLAFARPHVIQMTEPEEAHLISYLTARGVDSSLYGIIIRRAQGNWLVTRLLAGILARRPDANVEELPTDHVGLYDFALEELPAGDCTSTETRAVLGILAAAGAGPVLPIELLCAASGELGGSSRIARIRDILVDLRQFVVRLSPGTESEEVGLFHHTLVEYVFDSNNKKFGTDPVVAHSAVVSALDELAPMQKHDHNSLLHRYAAYAEPQHLWAMKDYARALQSLDLRKSPIPADNLVRLESWYPKVATILGVHAPETLKLRRRIASWTAETGKHVEALRLYQLLYNEQVVALGDKDPETLNSMQAIADLTANIGNAREALRLAKQLLPIQTEVQGAIHPDTLRTRRVIVSCTGETGKYLEALRLAKKLLPLQQKVLGSDHEDTLNSRYSIALWTAESGDYLTGIQLLEGLLADQRRILGADHPRTLNTRMDISACTGRMGKAEEALRLSRELLPIRIRVLGPDHPDTLNVRNSIAYWTDETGDKSGALRLYKDLLLDKQRLLADGLNHPSSLTTRNNIAVLTDETGDSDRAIEMYQQLLEDQRNVLGEDHPDTLTTRANIASWKHSHSQKDALDALNDAKLVLADRIRVLGRRHPETLQSRQQVAIWTAEQGNIKDAYKQAGPLLRDCERVLGADHPHTVAIRKLANLWQRKSQDLKS